jgi:hypothetical protein
MTLPLRSVRQSNFLWALFQEFVVDSVETFCRLPARTDPQKVFLLPKSGSYLRRGE